MGFNSGFKGLNAELNPICHLLALLGAHHVFHVSGLRVKKPYILLGSSKDESYSAQAATSLAWYKSLVLFVAEEKQLWQLLFLDLFVFRANYTV